MKRYLLIFTLLVAVVGQNFAQYPNVTIRQIQQVPLDSLLRADTLQNTQPSRWRLQTSPRYQDTVTVTAVCVVPAYPRWQPPTNDPLGAITFTRAGWTMLLADTGANPYPWGGILVRYGGDTLQAAIDGFLNVERGDVIRMTGYVDEFPAGSMNSATQFVPVPGRAITIIGSAPIPQPATVSVADFYTGIFPGGRIWFSRGEQWEGCQVKFDGALLADGQLLASRGTFTFQDGNGNQMADYDASKFFTLKGSSIDHPYPDSIWSIVYSSLTYPRQIDTLRGFITTVSGGENLRGYRIAPLYRRPYLPNDVVFGVVLPSISTHRRNPIVVPPDSSARVSVRVTRQSGGYPIATVNLLYSLNNAPFVSLPMTFQSSDTTYVASIPQQTANTFVHYFIKVTDSLGNSAMLANSASGGAASDSSRGFFFYTVLNRPLTIQDVQYTPYANGRSGYIGARVTVSGVITADTTSLRLPPPLFRGTTVWYLQSGTGPWSGLWIYSDSLSNELLAMRKGDSVTVTGTVSEYTVETSYTTRLQSLAAPIVVATNRPVPQPIVLPTSTFALGVAKGTPAAEQREAMLVQFNNVTLTDTLPTFGFPEEFEINDGSGPVLVRKDGKHTYTQLASEVSQGKTLIPLGSRISFLRGVITFSGNRYKLVPRANDDFGIITSVRSEYSPQVPSTFSLEQNYPNPFNPTTLIQFNLPVAQFATLKVYNLLGQEVQTLVNGVQAAGKYTIHFDASQLPSGVYFYRLQAAQFSQTKKMILVR